MRKRLYLLLGALTVAAASIGAVFAFAGSGPTAAGTEKGLPPAAPAPAQAAPANARTAAIP
jgi:hypothetical protein